MGAGLAPPHGWGSLTLRSTLYERHWYPHLHTRMAAQTSWVSPEPGRQRQRQTQDVNSDANFASRLRSGPGDKAEMPPERTGGQRSGSQRQEGQLRVQLSALDAESLCGPSREEAVSKQQKLCKEPNSSILIHRRSASYGYTVISLSL